MIMLASLTVWHINSIMALLISAIFTGWLIPKILLIAYRKRLFDEPNDRKIHHSSVPRLGGIAFEPVIIFTLFFLLLIDLLSGSNTLCKEYSQNIIDITIGVCSIILLYLVGIADDLIGVRYTAKFVVQTICGLLFVFAGLALSNLHGFLWLHEIPVVLYAPLSILFIVFVINAINLIDGIDGLASGLSGVALLYYGILFLESGQYTYALLSFASLGAIIPFFYFNVFGVAEKNRKIYMGDTGSLTIGIILCFLSIKVATIHPIEKFNPLAMALAPLAIPCMDVVRVFLHRIRDKKNPFLPDQNHIHHKLLKLGLKQKQTMITIIICATLYTLLIIWLSQYINITLLIILVVASYTFINLWLSQKINTKIG